MTENLFFHKFNDTQTSNAILDYNDISQLKPYMFRNIKKTKLVLIFLSGFAGMRDVEKTSSSSRLNNHICFSSEPSSSAMILPQIEENRSEMKDPKVRSLKRKHNGDSITLDRQVSTILKSFYAITYYFILRVIIFVAFRMEYLDIILLLWFTI